MSRKKLRVATYYLFFREGMMQLKRRGERSALIQRILHFTCTEIISLPIFTQHAACEVRCYFIVANSWFWDGSSEYQITAFNPLAP
jgi:hypothetical protein